MNDADKKPPRGPYRWGKGESGNPGGLSKEAVAARAFEEEARAQALAALVMLGNIAANEKQPPLARIAASQALMERAWGAPKPPADKNHWRKSKKGKTEKERPIVVVSHVPRKNDDA
jgi:hypothetical protein